MVEVKVSELNWESRHYCDGEDTLFSCTVDLGRLTVMDRLTGYGGGERDVESGFKDNNGLFWLVSGQFDIREHGELTVVQAVDLIKQQANTCKGE